MALSDNVLELIYWIMGDVYYKVTVTKNQRVVRKFVQKAASKIQGSEIALICKPLRAAWRLNCPKNAFTYDGNKILCEADFNNAMLLEEETSIEVITEGLTKKTITTKKLTGDIDSEENKNKGKLRIKKDPDSIFPPQLFFEEKEAFFIKQTLKNPPSKWEELKWVFIALACAGVAIFWIYMSNRGGVIS